MIHLHCVRRERICSIQDTFPLCVEFSLIRLISFLHLQLSLVFLRDVIEVNCHFFLNFSVRAMLLFYCAFIVIMNSAKERENALVLHRHSTLMWWSGGEHD